MTDKVPKYPEDFGSGVEEGYHIGKKEKILICAFIGVAILSIYYYNQIQNEVKTTDWSLDPNYQYTCVELQKLSKLADINGQYFDLDKFRENIIHKQKNLGCI